MRRVAFLAAGWVLVIAGAMLTPTPAPLGLPVLILGLVLLARFSLTVRRAIRALRGRFPASSGRIAAAAPMPRALPRAFRYLLLATDPNRGRKEHGRKPARPETERR